MANIAARLINLSVNGLGRRPVLAAMAVYSVGLGIAVLMAVFAVWRASSSCPLPRRPEHSYVVKIVERGVIAERGIICTNYS
jgi:hypothetical protein